MLIGRGVGYVALQIAVLFVGPEVLVAKLPAAITKLGAAGSRAAAVIRQLMEKIPALHRLLKAAGHLDKAGELASAEARLLSHLHESIVTKVLQQGLKQVELERLAKLEKTAGEKLLRELPASDVLALEQKLGKAELERLANSNKTINEIKGVAGKPQPDFVGDLRGERITLSGVKTQKITYTKRFPAETAQLRAEFNSTARKLFLEDLAKDSSKVNRLKASGLTESQIAAMRNGVVPQSYQVHHKLPLDDGGTNDLSNLSLVKNEPFHKVMTNAQTSLTRGMLPGETRVIDFPVPEGFVYP